MRAVIQRVSRASVEIKGQNIASIGPGLLVLAAAEEGDENKDYHYIGEKIINLRIFEDKNGKMNLSLMDVGGELLIVSQFTLLADCKKGRRPSFVKAMKPPNAQRAIQELINYTRARGARVQEGKFGAHMEVSLINDGPVTIILDSRRP